MKALFVAGFILLGVAGTAGAQAVRAPSAEPITPADVEELARFDDARTLATDPSGALYVTDTGRDVVVRLTGSGEVTDVLGGPGTNPGQFDDPVDIDPTNGLVLVVADAGNGRVQRFSRGGRLLEVVPVSRSATRTRPSYDRRRDGTDAPADGRPVAVALTEADELLVVDADRGVVLKWEPNRRAQHIIGGYGDGSGALIEPFALAIGPNDEFFVADRGHDAVLVYDAFGSFLQRLTHGAIEQARNIAVFGEELWIVQPDRLLVFNRRGALQRAYEMRFGEPLVDVARRGGTTYLLTTARLLRWNR